jgi:hypothetical protein
MGNVIQLAAHRLVAAQASATTVPNERHEMAMIVPPASGASLGDAIARMRSSLRSASDALKQVATESRENAAAYRSQAAAIRCQMDAMQSAMCDLKSQASDHTARLASRS